MFYINNLCATFITWDRNLKSLVTSLDIPNNGVDADKKLIKQKIQKITKNFSNMQKYALNYLNMHKKLKKNMH